MIMQNLNSYIVTYDYMEVISRVIRGPEVKSAYGRTSARASSLCVRAPCTDTPRTRSHGLDLGRIFVLWSDRPIPDTPCVVERRR